MTSFLVLLGGKNVKGVTFQNVCLACASLVWAVMTIKIGNFLEVTLILAVYYKFNNPRDVKDFAIPGNRDGKVFAIPEILGYNRNVEDYQGRKYC